MTIDHKALGRVLGRINDYAIEKTQADAAIVIVFIPREDDEGVFACTHVNVQKENRPTCARALMQLASRLLGSDDELQ